MPNVAARLLLRQSPLFGGLANDVIHPIADLASTRVFEKGQLVFHQGDTGDSLYGVSSGKVLIAANTREGKQLSLNIMERGDVFGEIALLDGGPRTATASALEKSQLVVIQRRHFHALIRREPSVAFALMLLMCRRLRWTTDLIEESALLSVRAQIAKRLVMLARIDGSETASGTEIRISQADLAQFLGVSRQVVNQHLQHWRRAGLIALGRARITIRGARAKRTLAGLTSGSEADGDERQSDRPRA